MLKVHSQIVTPMPDPGTSQAYEQPNPSDASIFNKYHENSEMMTGSFDLEGNKLILNWNDTRADNHRAEIPLTTQQLRLLDEARSRVDLPDSAL